MIFSDAGPDIRWVGNERGIAGDPCWSTLSTASLYPGFGGDDWLTEAESDTVKAWASAQDMLNQGDRHGDTWLPAECDVSIRPGWFYHASEDEQVKSPERLLDLYFKSIGRGASLLLNLPPDRRGRLHKRDIQSLMAFSARRKAIFDDNLAQFAEITTRDIRGGSQQYGSQKLIDEDPETYWATDDDVKAPSVVLTFREPVTFNIVDLREYLPLGQRVERFAVDIERDGTWNEIVRGTAIGNRRLLRIETCTTTRVRFRITASPVCPAISEFGLYFNPRWN